MTDNTPLPAAGWYPAPHANGEQRYWDGGQWTDWTPESAAAAQQSSTNPPGGVATATATIAPPQKKSGLRWWVWVLIGVGALIVLIIAIAALNSNPGSSNDSKPAAGSGGFTQESRRPSEQPTKPMPTLTGITVAEARELLRQHGMRAVVAEGVGEDWIVIATDPASGTVELGTEFTLTAEAPKPVYTLAQENAIESAQSYLRYSGFSRQGLIDQLVYEKFSVEDATFGADNAGADWNAEAAESAESYLSFTSMSAGELSDQLAYEGFTPEQIAFALAAVGY